MAQDLVEKHGTNHQRSPSSLYAWEGHDYFVSLVAFIPMAEAVSQPAYLSPR